VQGGMEMEAERYLRTLSTPFPFQRSTGANFAAIV